METLFQFDCPACFECISLILVGGEATPACSECPRCRAKVAPPQLVAAQPPSPQRAPMAGATGPKRQPLPSSEAEDRAPEPSEEESRTRIERPSKKIEAGLFRRI